MSVNFISYVRTHDLKNRSKKYEFNIISELSKINYSKLYSFVLSDHVFDECYETCFV